MPSFDIQSKVDVQTLDNAINSVNRELSTRYDFKGTHLLVELDKKAFVIKLEVDSIFLRLPKCPLLQKLATL
jgi:uncharacterized protein YajQ (UPF0234 family)